MALKFCKDSTRCIVEGKQGKARRRAIRMCSAPVEEVTGLVGAGMVRSGVIRNMLDERVHFLTSIFPELGPLELMFVFPPCFSSFCLFALLPGKF